MDLATYSREAESFIAELVGEYYRHEAGLKKQLEISPIYERHRGLFAPEVVRDLLSCRGEREGRYLAEFATAGLIENSLRELTEEIMNAEARASVEWEGRQVPYRQASILISNEPDHARRHELERLTVAETAKLNPPRERRLRRAHAFARELGFTDYVAMCESLSALHLDWLGPAMTELLARTRERHAAAMTSRLDAAGIPRAEATTADWGFLRRAQQFDHLFPKDELIPALKRTLGGMGIDLDSQENLHVDVEERPLKSPRAFCAPIRVPEDVWLVTRPHGGHDDYDAALHEAGHAVHYTHVSRDLPVAYRHLGDNSVTEAYAFLLGNLERNPVWLREVMGATDLEEYLALTRFTAIYMLRRYAAKLHFELELHRAPDPGAMGARYSQVLGEAVQVRVWPENSLSDLDDAFYCACYLRAWILEVQLRQALIKQFGERWFASRETGAYLRELWSLGQQLPAHELAQRLGYEGLEVEYLIQDLLGPESEI